jgi:ribosome-associated protein
LQQYQSNKISKDGELIITSQEHRTQAKNKDDCLDKLKEMIAEAYVEPKDRQMWEGIGEKGKEQRREEKRKRGAVKSSRQQTRDDFD